MSEILNKAAETAASAIMRFKAKTAGRYYPGYHEDMRDAVKRAILAADVAADPDLSSELDRLRDENERLKANIDRLTSNPADHRYWEGRYRDEANENDKLREAIIEACDLLMERKPGSLSRSPSHNARLRLEAAIGNWNGRALSHDNSTQKKEGEV